MAVNFIRAQRLGWLGHIKRMQKTRIVKAIYSWKPISIRPIGRPRHAGRMMLEKTYICIYRVFQEERAKLREGVPYVKLYQYNPKHLYPKFDGYGDIGQRSLRL